MSIKIRKVLYVLLSALMALALGLSLLRLLPGRAEDTLAVAGKYVEPWNNTSGTPGTYGSAKLSDGNYNIVVHNTNNFQGQIYNTVDKVNIEDMLAHAAEGDSTGANADGHGEEGIQAEAVQALVALGYGSTESMKAVKQASPECETVEDLEELLRRLSKKSKCGDPDVSE